MTVIHGPTTTMAGGGLYTVNTPSPMMPSIKKKGSISDGTRHISFVEGCKEDSSEQQQRGRKEFPTVSVIVEPPSPPVLSDEGRLQRISEIRRHSSHTASLSVKLSDRDRRHSGYNPNMGLDSEHMRFLSCSPAATRRISCGSLFKVRLGGM